MPFQNLCVFCASSPGARPAYEAQARALGQLLAQRGLQLVYGGGRVGLMGALADAALSLGGKVIGIIPEALRDRELAHRGLTQLHVVEDMHRRKAKLHSLADAYAVLPGGLGTLDEFFETLAWSQLNLHAKPVGLLNTESYFDPLLNALQQGAAEGFIQASSVSQLVVARRPEELLDALARRAG